MNNVPVSEKCKGSIKQLFRYALAGIVSNSVGYLVYLLVTHIGATPKISITLLYGMGATIGYFINIVILVVLVDHFMYPHQWVQAVTVFAVAGFLFIAFKFFVFTSLNVLKVDKS